MPTISRTLTSGVRYVCLAAATIWLWLPAAFAQEPAIQQPIGWGLPVFAGRQVSYVEPVEARHVAVKQNAPDSPPIHHDSSHGLRPMSELFVDAALPTGAVPEQPADERHAPNVYGRQLTEARPWNSYEFNWAASGMLHKPLYFEDVNLERYGNSACPFIQPISSGVRFFATVPMLPYKMTLEPPRECIYTLGYCRPGSQAPNLFYHPPLNVKAAIVEAAACTATVFLYH